MTDRRTDTLLPVRAVMARTGLSVATIYRREKDGTFPPRIRCGPKMVRWYESDVNEWIADPLGWKAAA